MEEVEHGPEAAIYAGGAGEPYYQPVIICLCGWNTGRCTNWEEVGAEFDAHLGECRMTSEELYNELKGIVHGDVVVVYAPPTLQPGDHPAIVFRTDSIREAEQFIADQETIDPEGIREGYYGVDAPEHLQNPKDCGRN